MYTLNILLSAAGARNRNGIPSVWLQQTSSFDATHVYDVVHGGGTWMAAGDAGRIASSLNSPTAWEQLETGFLASNSISSMDTANDGRVLLGYTDGSVRELYTTYDVGRMPFGGGAVTGVCWVHDDRGIRFSDFVIMASCIDGSVAVSNDSNGTSWTQRTKPFGSTGVTRIRYAREDGAVWASGTDGDIAVSRDRGITWTQRSKPFGSTGVTCIDVTDDGSVLVAGSTVGSVAYSDDGGLTWTQLGTPFQNSPISSICITSGNNVVVGGSGGVIAWCDGKSSPDLWSYNQPPVVAIAESLNRVAVNNITAIQIYDKPTDDPYYSGYFGFKTWWRARIATADGLYAEYREHTNVRPFWYGRYPRGITSSVRNIAYGDNLWVAAGDNGQIVTSSDGQTWLRRESPFKQAIYDTAYGNGHWVMVGESGSQVGPLLVGSTDGVAWTMLHGLTNHGGITFYGVAYGVYLWVAVGKSGALAYSTDGVNWTWWAGHLLNGTVHLRAVAYGNGRWVAVGDNGTLLTSMDGIHWTQRDGGFGTSNIKSVAFGNNLWIAVGQGGKIALSVDGTTWKQQSNSFGTTDINNISYGDKKWVAVGANGKIAVGV